MSRKQYQVGDSGPISATSPNQAAFAAKKLKAPHKNKKLENDARLARTQFHSK